MQKPFSEPLRIWTNEIEVKISMCIISSKGYVMCDFMRFLFQAYVYMCMYLWCKMYFLLGVLSQKKFWKLKVSTAQSVSYGTKVHSWMIYVNRFYENIDLLNTEYPILILKTHSMLWHTTKSKQLKLETSLCVSHSVVSDSLWLHGL